MMYDAILARIQQDMRACKLSYDETACLLTIEQPASPLFVYECTRLKLLHPSEEQLQQIALQAIFDALDTAPAVDDATTENDPTFLNGFAAWCDAVNVLGDGKKTVQEALQEALMEWRAYWQVWGELEAFLTKKRFLSYHRLFFIEDEPDAESE